MQSFTTTISVFQPPLARIFVTHVHTHTTHFPFFLALAVSLASLFSLSTVFNTHTHKQTGPSEWPIVPTPLVGRQVFACVRVHVCVCMCVYTYVRMCECVCVCVYCTCARVYIYVYTYTCTCVCVRVCGYIFCALSHSAFLTNASHETHESRQTTSDTMQIHTHVRVTWLIHMCAMTHSYVWLDLLICVTRIIHMISWLMDGLPAATKYCLTGNFRWTVTTYAASLLKSRGVSSCVLPCVAIWRGVF